MLKPLFVCNRY